MTDVVADKVHGPIHRVAMAFEREGDRLLVSALARRRA